MRSILRLGFIASVVAASILPHQRLYAQARLPPPPPVVRPAVQVAPAPTRTLELFAGVSLADIGFNEGFRFANLGGRARCLCHCPGGVKRSRTSSYSRRPSTVAFAARPRPGAEQDPFGGLALHGEIRVGGPAGRRVGQQPPYQHVRAGGGSQGVSTDEFAERLAKVRQRFVSTLEHKIRQTYAALRATFHAPVKKAPAIALIGPPYLCVILRYSALTAASGREQIA